MKQLRNTTHPLLAFALISTTFYAHADEDAIRKVFAKSMPSIKIDSVKPSEAKGVYELSVGAIFYMSLKMENTCSKVI